MQMQEQQQKIKFEKMKYEIKKLQNTVDRKMKYCYNINHNINTNSLLGGKN